MSNVIIAIVVAIFSGIDSGWFRKFYRELLNLWHNVFDHHVTVADKNDDLSLSLKYPYR